MGIYIPEKVVSKLMAEAGIKTHFKRKRFQAYQGEITPAPDNLAARNFHAARPNEKWLTDITEFSIPAGKIYLSPIIDCFDGFVVSWTIAMQTTAEMANTMLDKAACSLQEDAHKIIHSDRGGHYCWSGWIERVSIYRLICSMSKKAFIADNAACEGFFGRIKNEMFYNRSCAAKKMGLTFIFQVVSVLLTMGGSTLILEQSGAYNMKLCNKLVMLFYCMKFCFVRQDY